MLFVIKCIYVSCEKPLTLCLIFREEKSDEAQESPKEEMQVEEPLPSTERKDSCDSAEIEEGSEEGSESEKSNTGRDFVMV